MLFLGACENSPKQTMGGVLGGGLSGAGAFLISKGIKGGKYQIPLTVVSAGLGALVGSSLGKVMDQSDQMYHLATTQIALETIPTNQPKQWDNPKTQSTGVIVPTETFQKPSGQPCRKYSFHILHDQKVSSGNGLSCRNEKSGKWESIGTPSLSTL